MATNAQRAQSIANAVVNGTATLAQIDRIGRAIAAQAGRSAEYLTLADADKAAMIVAHYRAVTLAWVQQADAWAAQEAARLAQSSAAADLPEAP